MKTTIIAIALAAIMASAANAASDPKDAAQKNYLNLSPVALPVIVGGQVVNYVFVNVRINLAPSADSESLRAQEPFFRDALVREAHRTPFTLASDYTKIDEGKLSAALLVDARTLAGPGVVTGVQVLQQTPKSTRVASTH